MTPEEQLKEWVKGNPIHNKERDECCPDFSCCTGKIAPVEERRRFVRAFQENNQEVIMDMLGMFLTRLLSCSTGKEVIVLKRKIMMERDLKELQCFYLCEGGICITNPDSTDEKLAYGSYTVEIYINGTYIGRSKHIALWGPCRLKQTAKMEFMAEYSTKIDF